MSFRSFVGFVIVLLGTAAVGFWAGRVALEPPEDPLAQSPEPLTYVVELGSVGRSFNFTAVAEWSLTPAGLNAATGVVTTVEITSGSELEQGKIVYTVNLRPVVVARGDVPMFRQLHFGTKGGDVAQFQALLADLGFYSGEIDGSYGRTTRSAVRAWQESLGVKDTGVVEAGDLIFLPRLPVRISLTENLTVGARLFGGETVFELVDGDPVFRVPLAVEQAALIPLSADVLVEYPEGVWNATVERAVEDTATGRLDLFLVGADGGPVCGNDCAQWVDLANPTRFAAELIAIPLTTGPVVPVAAITTSPGNQPAVTLVDGTRVPIEIVQSAQGIAVVDGIEPGTEILLPTGEP